MYVHSPAFVFAAATFSVSPSVRSAPVLKWLVPFWTGRFPLTFSGSNSSHLQFGRKKWPRRLRKKGLLAGLGHLKLFFVEVKNVD
jgi:hypothetical protein